MTGQAGLYRAEGETNGVKFTGGLIYLSDRQARGQINLVDTAGIAARRYYTPAMQASVNPAGTFLTMPEGDQFPIRPANP